MFAARFARDVDFTEARTEVEEADVSDALKYKFTQATRPERFVVREPIVVLKEDGSVGYVQAGTELTIEVPHGPITVTADEPK